MSSSFTFIIFSGLILAGCSRTTELQNSREEIRTLNSPDVFSDSARIQEVVWHVLDWSQSDSAIVVNPVIETGGVYLFDKNELRKNLDRLRLTGFFANEFIENYNQIILKLEEKLRSQEFDPWLVGDLPPFKFANDADPWCMCQGFSVEQYERVEIVKMDKQSAEGFWRWKQGNSWVDFMFRVSKEHGKWKISYMQGFDYAESIKKDGDN
ncbi:MAG: hypothetical protein JNL17_14970 [Cyclobacteriaceae bacterium]|nr:hypothetical protein [Cyclobacteriaceae bacterium]